MYHFLVKTPTSFRINGQIHRYLEVGAVISLADELGALVQKRQVVGTEHLQLVSIDQPKEAPAPKAEAKVAPAPVPEPAPKPKVAEELVSEPKVVTEPVKAAEAPAELEVPLAENAHWSTVRSFILKMEEEGNMEMIKAVKAKYPEFRSVQEEADRILGLE